MNDGLDEAQAGIKIAGRNINNLRYADDTTLMAESGEERKSLLMKVKEQSGEMKRESKYSCIICNPETLEQPVSEAIAALRFLINYFSLVKSA